MGLDNEDGVLGRQKGLLSSTIVVSHFPAEARFSKKLGRIFRLEGMPALPSLCEVH